MKTKRKYIDHDVHNSFIYEQSSIKFDVIVI